jgi:O-antigen/teichoic acid export membrane protein
LTPSKDKALHEPGLEGFFRKSVFVTIGQLSVALLFVVYVFAARALGDAAFGQFMLGLAIASVLFMLPAWGVARYSAIMAARDPERTGEIVATYLGFTLPTAALYFPLLAWVAQLIGGDTTVVHVALFLGVDQLARSVGNCFRFVFRVHDAYPLEALTSFVERGAVVAAAMLVLLIRPDPVSLAAAFAAGRLAGALVTIVLFQRRIAPVRVRFDLAAIRRLAVGGTPVALRQGVGHLTFRVDLLFLGALRGAREVGWYGSVYTVMDGAVMLPHTVNGSLGPTISANFGRGDLETVRRLYHRGLKYLIILGLFLGAVLAVLAGPFVALVYGGEYAPAVPALVLLALSIPFVFVRSNTTEVLDNVDLRGMSLKVFALGLVINVVLNTLLVPSYGHVGAAGATLMTEVALAVGMGAGLARAGYRVGVRSLLRAPVLAIVPATGIMWALQGLPVLAALTGAVTYVAALTVAGAWDEKDVRLFRGVGDRLRGRAGRP